MVVEARKHLEQSRYLQIGASAVQEELRKMGSAEIPQIWTINRIISRHGLVKKKTSYQPKGVPYFSFARTRPNQLQAGDILGPRHIRGDGRFYSLNMMDLFRHKVALCITRTQHDQALCEALLGGWSRLGLPERLQLDNQLPFRGSNKWPHSFGEVIRLCLHLGVELVFIPIGEPWRNGEIERFNDTFERKFFRTQVFPSFENLKEEAVVFEAAHNQRHRYSCLKGKTPEEMEEKHAFKSRFPPPDVVIPDRIPRKGKVHLVRFVRSDCLLDVFSEKFVLPKSLVYEYVVATIHLRAQKLRIYSNGEVACEFDYELP